MKTKYLFSFLLMMAGAGLMAQTTVWNPAANHPSDGLWTTAANWTAGVPDPASGKAVFNVPDAMACTVESDVSLNQIVQGENNTGDTLIVATGGSITTGAVWSGIGYNDVATLIVESGGTFSFGQHAWLGQNAGGVANVHISGTMNVAGMTGLGWSGGTGYVTVYDGGIMNCAQFSDASIKGGSVLDIRGGTVNLTGDKVGLVNSYIDAGDIVSYSGGGTLNVELTGGITVITSNADVTAPTIVSTSPEDQDTGIPVITNIRIEFSEAMNMTSVEDAITISPDITNQAYSWTGNTLTISGDDMTALTAYTVTVGTAATDLNDLAIESEYSFGFTTADPDAPPSLVTTVPDDGATGVARDADLVMNFSKAMVTAGVEAAFSSDPAMTNVSFTWSNGDKTATVSHDNLAWETAYTVTIASGIESVDGKTTTADESFGFTVMAQPLTDIIWEPATDGSSDSLWTTAANWSIDEVADGNYKVKFVNGDVPASHLDAAVTIHQLVMGDNGPGDSLVIEDGGSLTTGDVWSAIGYNNTATLVVETGGSITFGNHAWLGFNPGADVEVHINGGTLTVTAMTGIGWRNGTGLVYVNDGGVMNCAQFNGMSADASIKDGSVLDISGGTVNLTGDKVGIVNEYIEAGKITAYGGTGVVRVDLEDGTTVITSAEAPSTDASLSEITVSAGTLTPAFDAATMDYTVVAPSGTETVTVTAEATDPYATVAGAGDVDVSSGNGTATIVVTAEDETVTQTYTVVISVPSSDATLSALSLDPGTLTPAFDAATTAYTAEVPNGTESVAVTAVANHSEATVTGDGALDVSSGSGTASVVVTAEDGSTLTYTVEITVSTTSVPGENFMKIKAYYINKYDLVRIENASSVKSVKVIDITGKAILITRESGAETLDIGTRELEEGIYILQMELPANQTRSVKFVK